MSFSADFTNSSIPKHVAIIMDGNRRWARQNKLQVFRGHEKVAQENLEKLVDHCISLKIPHLTLWAFSTENWKRDEVEVQAILDLIRKVIERGVEKMLQKQVKIEVIGDISRFPEDIQEGIAQMRARSADHKKITVTFALNYGGRNEVSRAIKKLIDAGETDLSVGEIESRLNDLLDSHFLPDPDLIIRTGGEQRLSGFMPWQGIYAELYFTSVLMPDFGEEELNKAIKEYCCRCRRFGK